MSDKDGGPAFPVTPTDNSGQIAPTQLGMSLRDWFAGQALMGMLADHTSNPPRTATASLSYALADAMLAERQK